MSKHTNLFSTPTVDMGVKPIKLQDEKYVLETLPYTEKATVKMCLFYGGKVYRGRTSHFLKLWEMVGSFKISLQDMTDLITFREVCTDKPVNLADFDIVLKYTDIGEFVSILQIINGEIFRISPTTFNVFNED